MSSRYPPDDPRSRGSVPPGGAGASRGQPPGDYGGPPRYIPAQQPPLNPYSARGQAPSRQPPAKLPYPTAASGKRTDPSLYEWDRLSQEQQQAVLATLGAQSPGRRSSRRIVVALLLALLILVLALIAAYALLHGI